MRQLVYYLLHMKASSFSLMSIAKPATKAHEISKQKNRTEQNRKKNHSNTECKQTTTNVSK